MSPESSPKSATGCLTAGSCSPTTTSDDGATCASWSSGGSPVGSELLSKKWDERTQTPHGGQDWRDIGNFVEDFSVTTNPLGTPEGALKAATDAVKTILHYPPADFEPAWSSLSRFLAGETEDMRRDEQTAKPAKTSQNLTDNIRSRLLLGNGASEMIDLCIRLSPGSTWRPGPSSSQYKEYERSATNNGRRRLAWDDPEGELLCMVNPCNPTGDFLPLAELKATIERVCTRSGTTVIVDESMQPWIGPHWRSESLTSQGDWISSLSASRGVSVHVLHSWTKLWSCPGLRIGSLLMATPAQASVLRRNQVPWSLNSPAVAFLDAVVADTKYLEDTWSLTSAWRAYMVEEISKMHPTWSLKGKSFLSYIWIDTKDATTAQACVARCRELGVPIRWGKFGYEESTHIRLAVRRPEEVKIVLEALSIVS